MRFPCGRRCLLGFVSWLVSVCVTSLKVQAAEPRPETPLRRTGPQGTRNATDNFGSAAAGFAQAPGGGFQTRKRRISRVRAPGGPKTRKRHISRIQRTPVFEHCRV